MSKAKFAAAKELIDEKKYDEARGILKTIDHPTAREWEAKLDKISPRTIQVVEPAPIVQSRPYFEPAEPEVRMQRFWRTIWGILTIISIGWMCYGLYAASTAYSTVASKQTTEAGKGGAAIGASIGFTGVLCIGVPFFLLFVVLYWRNGVAIRRAEEHAETINALHYR